MTIKRKSGRIYIGTSGWSYAHWSGKFYPRGLSGHKSFAYYCQHFETVEINRTFYSLPGPEAVRRWRDEAPNDFVFAVKASRYITHMKKLKDAQPALNNLMACVQGLGVKAGPVLFQLPPHWHANPDRLEAFLEQLPEGSRYSFEFRNPSWFKKPVYELLQHYGAALCLYDLAGRQAPMQTTADFVYIRLHGPEDAYRGRYQRNGLAPWVRSIRQWQDEGLDVYCYFDNDEKAFAPRDALELIEMMQA